MSRSGQNIFRPLWPHEILYGEFLDSNADIEDERIPDQWQAKCRWRLLMLFS